MQRRIERQHSTRPRKTLISQTSWSLCCGSSTYTSHRQRQDQHQRADLKWKIFSSARVGSGGWAFEVLFLAFWGPACLVAGPLVEVAPGVEVGRGGDLLLITVRRGFVGRFNPGAALEGRP